MRLSLLQQLQLLLLLIIQNKREENNNNNEMKTKVKFYLMEQQRNLLIELKRTE